jgi:hypothetical protein
MIGTCAAAHLRSIVVLGTSELPTRPLAGRRSRFRAPSAASSPPVAGNLKLQGAREAGVAGTISIQRPI